MDSTNSTYLSEREAWNEYMTGEKATDLRATANEAFINLRPVAHKILKPELLRIVAGMIEKSDPELQGRMYTHLRDVLPDTLRLIADLGVIYRPFEFLEPPSEEPKSRLCFQKAINKMHAHNFWREKQKKSGKKLTSSNHREMVYVEGISLGICADPMLHAWNAFTLRGRSAMDFSWYMTSRWAFYRGIALTGAEQWQIRKILGRNHGGVLHRNWFTKEVRQFIVKRSQMEIPKRMELTATRDELLGKKEL